MSIGTNAKRAVCFLIALAVLCLLPTGVRAQNFTTFTEWRVPTAATQPLYIAVSGNNGAYFAEQFGGKIGFLDIRQNVITEWTLPAGSQPTRAVPQGQKVALVEENGHVGVFDPNGSTVTEWTVPLIESFSLPLGVASQGKLMFFTDFFQGVVGMVDTSTDEVTLWRMPGGFRLPNQMVLSGPSSNLQVWVADSVDIISMLNPDTDTSTEWSVPLRPFRPVLQNLAIAPDGSVLFQDFVNDFVGTLNPTANLIREWLVPTPNSQPVNVAVLSPDIAAFVEESGNRIGTLDLTTTPNFVNAVTPTVTTVTPITFVVTPQITALPKTITLVTPIVTPASRLVTDGFIEYPVPTAGSGPVGLSLNSNRAIIFTESSAAGNSIGLLR